MIIINMSYNGVLYHGYDELELLKLGIPDIEIKKAIEKQNLDGVINARRAAYVSESDPIFIEWKYDQTPEKEKEWRDKVVDIKNRYPLP